MHMKTLFSLALAFAVFAPFSAVQAYGHGGCDGFFFACGTGYGAPREELIVYAWGPGTTAQSPYSNYQQPQQYQQYQQPYQNYYQPYQQYYQPMYQPSYQPNYYQPTYQYSYNQPQYYPQNSYSYPQYNSYNYYQPEPYFGYSPQPMGTQDLFGNQLCDWGTGYRGYRCDYDPHQWILDPYTGQYY